MIYLRMLICALTVGLMSSPALATDDIGKLVKADKMEHDFGTIAQGQPQTTIFTLTNLSDQPMVLKKVKGSCGCTATSYSQDPIQPGESTEIEATYNAKAKGPFTKTVTVQTNLEEEPIILKIKGTVSIT